MPASSCLLDNEKEDFENVNNRYSENFKNIYCYCKQGYNGASADMIECMACEEWYHFEHLIPSISESVDEDFILFCRKCQVSQPHLRDTLLIHKGSHL